MQDSPAFDTRWLERSERLIYLCTGILLVVTAAGLLVIAAGKMVQRLIGGEYIRALLPVLDRSLLLLMLAAVIYTVRRVARSTGWRPRRSSSSRSSRRSAAC